MTNTEATQKTKKHNMFACTSGPYRHMCSSCRDRYLAWCDDATSLTPDARWDNYNNPGIKDRAAARGYLTNSDLMCCSYSLTELWDATKASKAEKAA